MEYLKNYEQRSIILYRKQQTKPSQRKRNARKQSGCLRSLLQIAEERREVKSKGERERYAELNAEFQRIAKKDKKAFNEQ